MAGKRIPKTIGALKGAPLNERLRKISEEALDGLGYLMDRFGDLSGIIWNKRSGNLAGGHQRVRALREKYGDELEIKDGKITTPDGQEFAVRVVDWDEDTERAALVAANNKHVQGSWTTDLDSAIDDIEGTLPDAFDAGLLNELRRDADVLEIPDLDNENLEDDDDGPAKMELQPYEHHDYVVFLFDDERDWNMAVNKLGLAKVNASPIAGKKKIGLGRVLNGTRLLRLLEDA